MISVLPALPPRAREAVINMDAETVNLISFFFFFFRVLILFYLNFSVWI